jgi:hypothetical protein
VVFRCNALAKEAGLSLCAGNGSLSTATLGKWLDLGSPHLPGTMATKVLCEVLKNVDVYRLTLESQGLGIMTAEDKKYCCLGRAVQKAKEARRALKRVEDDF